MLLVDSNIFKIKNAVSNMIFGIDGNGFLNWRFYDSNTFTNENNRFIIRTNNNSLDIIWIDMTKEDIDHQAAWSFTSDGSLNLSKLKSTSLNLSKFDTTNVNSMQSMFYDCRKIDNLDLSSFNTRNVTNMEYMFFNCVNLKSVTTSSFNTANVTKMQNMFAGCSSLTTLDLSNFNTTKVDSMQFMFYSCSKLTNLVVTSFDTRKVTDMQNMFYNCSSLTTLDLSSFDTASVTNMESMFESCKFNVNFNGKNTSNVQNAYKMFKCFGGTSINMNNCSLASSTNNTDFITSSTITDLISPRNISSNINISANKLTLDSLLSLINGLADVPKTQTLDIGGTNLAKLSEDQLLVAINKNWTVC